MEAYGGAHVINGFDILFIVLLILSIAVAFKMLLKPKNNNNKVNKTKNQWKNKM